MEVGSTADGLAKVAGKPFFQSADGGFQVLPIIMSDSQMMYAAEFRPALNVTLGTEIKISGTYAEYKGRPTIKVTSAEIVLPSDIDGILHWAHKKVKGLGAKSLAKMAKAIGPDLAQAMGDPLRLHKQGHLRLSHAEELASAWMKDLGENRVYVFLRSYGIRPARIKDVIAVYGPNCEASIKEDPWQLSCLVGISFETCDKIAQNLKLLPDHPSRIIRGIAAAFDDAAQREGHTGLPLVVLIDRAKRLLNLSDALISEGIERAVEERLLYHCPVTDLWGAPDTIDTEYSLAREIARLKQAPGLCTETEAESAIAAAELDLGITLDRESGQFLAAVRALSEGFSVITGGPGTGKSTIQGVVVNAARSLRNMSKEKDICIGAPTGRAAKRLSETTSSQARTIHQMLEFSAQEGQFKVNKNNPLDARLIIVDEASMLDTYLAASLLQSIKSGSSLILVGDVDQLPSVGPGQVLRDIIASQVAPVTRLTRVRRTSQGSEIPLAASRVNAGLHPVPTPGQPLQGVHLVEPASSEDIPRLLSRIMSDRIKNLNVDPKKDVQVIVSMRKGPCGVESLNEVLRQILNPLPPASFSSAGRTFGIDDRVMQTKNDHPRGLSNGDIGEVISIQGKGDEAEMLVDFGNGLIANFNQGNSENLVHARVTTVHKSQGSEFPVVIVIAPQEHARMLDRNLLYTAMTRARKTCILIGERAVIEAAASRSIASKRITGLQAYLTHFLGHSQVQAPSFLQTEAA